MESAVLVVGIVLAVVTAPSHGAKYNYKEILAKSSLFYEAQRSGKLPPENRIKWRGDSAMGDKGQQGQDLTGGWYDAGDHVKFGLPMAWSAMTLTWGLIDHKDAYVKAGEYQNMKNCVKWPMDYFMKAHTAKDEFYAQVGDPNADHSFWGRAEDMKMYRPSYKLSASKPGSDVVGESAATLAAGSIVFKDDAAYSAKLLKHAKELYDFAKTHQGIYTREGGIPASPFYTSSSFKDDLCVAAAWLYRATSDKTYLNDAMGYDEGRVSWALSWDDNYVSCQLLLYGITKNAKYQRPVVQYMTQWLPGGSVPYTPKGLAWRLQWGSNRYAANSAFVAAKAASMGINTAQYKSWAEKELGYMLGDAGHSFVVGFGNNPPTHEHHRGASCPNRPAPCGQAQFSTPNPNPQVLYGALVGGPGQHDEYADVRSDYVKNEVATDYNAGFTSAIAALSHMDMTNDARAFLFRQK
ncbi:uncharacterized protein LOC106161501 [Lingula anatina]|uniref:Endoglucanase n=1 Tax=Lingula anatina TaxID=7574 RepID=A0A1S3I6T6_LINAN|nr:uncharacterized protein LOC106161501 [Lingula anatina]|eukprot:XP_013393923.1 uncharacterized protein LOC106161501 [Lingula anatina]